MYKPGDWFAICDSCGFKFYASQLKKRFDGFMVCSKDWESQHPQEFVRSIPERPALPWARPDIDGVDVDVDYISESIGAQDTEAEITPDGDFNNGT